MIFVQATLLAAMAGLGDDINVLLSSMHCLPVHFLLSWVYGFSRPYGGRIGWEIVGGQMAVSLLWGLHVKGWV